MDFLSPEIEKYAQDHTRPENDLLKQINRETHLKVLMPRMLSGHLQGRVLSMISHMIKPQRILEIGTYTGYSALCLAEGLAHGGKLITIDINAEIEKMVRDFFAKSPLNNSIEYKIGDAMKIIPSINETFDLVFIDADKENYMNYYSLVFDKLKPGGFIIADNVLWSGKVLNDENKMDKDTRAIREYSKMVQHDARVENVLLPVRDGLMICRKK